MKQISDCNLPINPRYGVPSLSWSDMVAIETSVEKWLKGIKFKNRAMEYGTHIHLLIEKGHLDVPRLGNPEQKYQAEVPTGKGKKTFMVVGKIDDSDDTTIIDYKTCAKLWTQKQAEEHGQLKGYAFLRWKSTGKLPTKGVIVALETEPHEDSDSMVLTGKTAILEVPITLLDVLKIQARFQKAYWKVIKHTSCDDVKPTIKKQ
jgi:hypothetical protein